MAQFASDSFTNTDGTTLSSHSANWTKHTNSAYSSGGGEIKSNRACTNSTNNLTCWHHSGAPSGTDYSVSGDFYFVETDAGSSLTYLGARIDTTANTMYIGGYAGSANDNWRIVRIVAGTATSLGTSAASVSATTTKAVKLEVTGNGSATPKLYVDTVLTINPGADGSPITAAGKSGWRGNSGPTVGIHLDNFSADDIASDVTVALTGSAVTVSTGTLGVTTDKALTGEAATISAGTLGVSASATLTGEAATISAGTLTPSIEVALTGEAVTVSAGTLTPTQNDVTVALTGEAVTVSAGTLAPSIDIALSGTQVNAAAGTLTASGGDVVAATGGGIGHGGFSRLIIVEVDGEEFRVPESQLKAFLEALRETVEEAPLRVTKKRTKKRVQEVEKQVEVKILQAPKEIRPYVALQIDRTTEIINRIVHNAYMEYMEEKDDEEALLLLL